MSNATLEVSEAARAFAERKAREKGFRSASAYVEAILERGRRREARTRLEKLLIEGLESGPALPFTPEDWARMREDLSAKLAERHDRVEALLIEGLESGSLGPMKPEDWEAMRARLRDRLAKEGGA